MSNYKYHEDGTMDRTKIFVFGSNLAGVHGAGAAKAAYREMNAQWKVGRGFTGHAYAIPTKDHDIQTLPIDAIKEFVDEFLVDASRTPELEFFVTRIGCGLAGYKDSDIAVLFRGAPSNCDFPIEWRTYLEEE